MYSVSSFYNQVAGLPDKLGTPTENLAALPEKVNQTAHSVLEPAAKVLGYTYMAYNLCKNFSGGSFLPDLIDPRKLGLLTNGTGLLAICSSPQDLTTKQALEYCAKMAYLVKLGLGPVINQIVAAETLPYKIFEQTPVVLGAAVTAFTLYNYWNSVKSALTELAETCSALNFG